MNNIFENIPNLYSNLELQKFFARLESKYLIENACDKYQKLVNSSTNNRVPYHKWFKYREGFSSQLISALIQMSKAKADEAIIDPFCGSGTTNVVAFMQGFDTLGVDVNPMSVFITEAKTTHYSKADIENAEKLLLEYLNCEKVDVVNEYLDIKKYFNSDSFNELTKIKNFLDSLNKDNSYKILFVAFLSIIESCSDRKRDGNGLKKSLTNVKDVKNFFVEKVRLIIDDIKNNQPDNNAVGVASFNTALNLYADYQQRFSNRVGAIIFSPPYANSFDYFESYKLELVFGGFAKDIGDIAKLRKNAVRSFVGAERQLISDKYVELIAQEIELAIPEKESKTKKHDGRTRKVPDMLKGYFSDMFGVIEQCSKCLVSGKKTYIVVDQSSYLGKIVPTDLLFAYYAEKVDFKVNRIIECRKARTSTQQLNQYPYLKYALRESIVELEKK